MKRAAAIIIVALVISLTLASPARACLWDTDTLLDEQRGMPTVASILAGKWERHSPFFYEQRIAAARKTLDSDPKNLAAMDDLSVALEKTGHVNDAIDVMKRKLEIDPAGYTTHANLGTFYLHSGDLDAGITHIKRALEINPSAHFGRERYQLMVAQYIRDGKKNPAVYASGSFVMPVIAGESEAAEIRTKIGDDEYFKFLATARTGMMDWGGRRDGPEVDKAIEGVVGMIRFGTGTSPDLFYALGDLLSARGDFHLAYRAYRRAIDLGLRDPEQIREAMDAARARHEDQSKFADDVIAAEQKDGSAWLAAYQAYEDDLLRTGRDVADTAQFAAFYKQHGDPRAKPSNRAVWIASAISTLRRNPMTNFLIVAGIALVIACIARFRRDRRKRRAATAAMP
jgi:tetratricopeptide (TPR) repeat protein